MLQAPLQAPQVQAPQKVSAPSAPILFKSPLFKSPEDYQVYRLSPDASNRIALVFDPTVAKVSLTYCVEIFDVGGRTYPHRHRMSAELFFVLKGEGKAVCDDEVFPIQTGDSILMPPDGLHAIENSGSERLYTLCVMVPDEGFVDLIRSGIPTKLDEEDMAVLKRIDLLF